MSIKIIVKNKNLSDTEYELLDNNLEIKVNCEDEIFVNVDINQIKLNVINNKNLEILLNNEGKILLENMVSRIFQNELQNDKISTLTFLFNVEENMNYVIDSMKTLFDAIDFTSSNFNKFKTSTSSLEQKNKDILFNEEEFAKNKDDLFKNTEKNDLIFYDEVIDEEK